jgi:hypothetical protein
VSPGVEVEAYSGHGRGLNNPGLEAVDKVGPIPAGRYAIGPSFHHPRLGPLTMRLTPINHTALGRSGFCIHGDNALGDHSASEGCIVAPREGRLAIDAQTDRVLDVAP